MYIWRGVSGNQTPRSCLPTHPTLVPASCRHILHEYLLVEPKTRAAGILTHINVTSALLSLDSTRLHFICLNLGLITRFTTLQLVIVPEKVCKQSPRKRATTTPMTSGIRTAQVYGKYDGVD